MSLINQKSQTFIASRGAGILSDSSENSLTKTVAGTKNLTGVRGGKGKRLRISFIPEKVISLKIEWIEAVRKRDGKVLRLVG